MNPNREEQQLVADQAADWMLRLKSDGPQAEASLLKWLQESPLHVREFLLASGVDDALGNLDPERSVDVDALIAHAHAKSKVVPLGGRPSPPPRRVEAPLKSRRFIGLAASLSALALLGLFAWVTYFQPGHHGIYATELGAQRTFKLADGSVVILNTESQIQVRYTEASRDVYLDQGQALFQVYHDATRPFRVHAASTVIQAIGTQFDVRRFADRTTVAVVEGTVQVSTSKPQLPSETLTIGVREPVKITVGEGATVDASGRIELADRINTEAATAWRHQRLVFIDTPLSEIASEFNRYNTSPRLRIESDELQTKVFSGSFNAFSPQSFIAYLSHETDFSTERRGDDVVIRPRVSGSSNTN